MTIKYNMVEVMVDPHTCTCTVYTRRLGDQNQKWNEINKSYTN